MNSGVCLLKRFARVGFSIDLPGHGNDRADPADSTFQDYVEAVCRAIASLRDTIVVGHSMTAILSEVPETIPDRVRALVYVAGHLLPAGQSMMQTVERSDPEYVSQLLWAPDRRTARIHPQGIRTFLYPLCPPGIVEEVLPKFTAEPVAPFEHPIRITPENYGRVPRYYVECLQDRVVPLAVQRQMHSNQGCKRVLLDRYGSLAVLFGSGPARIHS